MIQHAQEMSGNVSFFPQNPNLLYDSPHVPVSICLQFCIYKLRNILSLRAWALSLDRHGFRVRLFQLLTMHHFEKVRDSLASVSS